MNKKKIMVGFIGAGLIVFVLFISVKVYESTVNYTSKEILNDSVIIKEVNINAYSDSRVNEIINRGDLESGIYSINRGNTFYVYFNGIDCEYTDFSFTVENNIFIISFDSIETTFKEASRKVFEIHEKEDIFDTVMLLDDGKNTPFKIAFGY